MYNEFLLRFKICSAMKCKSWVSRVVQNKYNSKNVTLQLYCEKESKTYNGPYKFYPGIFFYSDCIKKQLHADFMRLIKEVTVCIYNLYEMPVRMNAKTLLNELFCTRRWEN